MPRSPWPIVASLLAGALAVEILKSNEPATHAAAPDELAALKAEVDHLKTLVTDQSHVMADVSYHFDNLWFAGQNENWPLAQFYFDETHSHLKWAVRVIPVRKDRAGRDVDLGGILTALEQTSLKDLDAAIKAKDKDRFSSAYTAQLKNCMACHEASSKEFIQLHVPERADAGVVEFGAKAQQRPASGAAE